MGAAMQALKQFTSGGGGQGQGGGLGGGAGGGQNQFIGMAMGQASSLFDRQSAQGNVVCILPLTYDCQLTFSRAGMPARRALSKKLEKWLSRCTCSHR